MKGRWATGLGALAASMLAVTTLEASPWTKSWGEAYLKVGEGFFLSNSYVDTLGQLQSGSSYFGASTFAYLEVGLLDRFQVQAYVPYTFALSSFSDGWQYLRGGRGDAVVGLQWSPPISFPAAIRADVKIPLYDVGYFASFGPLAEKFPSLGDGQVDETVWLSLGDSVPGTNLYAFGEVGYRLRSKNYIGAGDPAQKDFADTFVFQGQAGYRLLDGLIVALNSSLVMPLEKDAITHGFWTLGGSAYYPIAGAFAVEASVDPIVWARNSSRGFGFCFGVSYQL